MSFLEKLRLFTQGFMEGFMENPYQNANGDFDDADDEPFDDGVPDPFDTFDMTRSLYYNDNFNYNEQNN